MDKSAALMKLMDSADLLRMLEDILSSSSGSVPASMHSGFRLTLKNVRDDLVAAHDILAGDYLNSSRSVSRQEPSRQEAVREEHSSINATREEPSGESFPGSEERPFTPTPQQHAINGAVQTGRKQDLRSSIEKIVSRSSS